MSVNAYAVPEVKYSCSTYLCAAKSDGSAPSDGHWSVLTCPKCRESATIRHIEVTPRGAASWSSARSMQTIQILGRSLQALERCLHVRDEIRGAILDAHEVSVSKAVVPGHVAEHLE